MTNTTLPPLDGLDFDALVQLRDQVEARLDQLRNEFMAQANAMGLSCTLDAPKKRKRRSHQQKESD
jgi:hypothetical protein